MFKLLNFEIGVLSSFLLTDEPTPSFQYFCAMNLMFDLSIAFGYDVFIGFYLNLVYPFACLKSTGDKMTSKSRIVGVRDQFSVQWLVG